MADGLKGRDMAGYCQWRDTCFANVGQCFAWGATKVILARVEGGVNDSFTERAFRSLKEDLIAAFDAKVDPLRKGSHGSVEERSIHHTFIHYLLQEAQGTVFVVIVSVPSQYFRAVQSEAGGYRNVIVGHCEVRLQKYHSFNELKQRLKSYGEIWNPNKVYHKKREMLGEITGKTLVSSMTLQDLDDPDKMMLKDIQKDQEEVLLKCLKEARQKAEKVPGRAVELHYLLVLHASKWNVKLESGETLEDVPFLHLDFRGTPKPDRPRSQLTVKLTNQPECMIRGYHKGTCESCHIEMSQLADQMTSALVDGFSGPMEIAITSCVGLPRTWNFNAGLAETCGLCFCCYFLPHNILWFEGWASNLLRDALVGKSDATRFAIAVVHDGGDRGNFMQQMELPFTYLYDLPVLLLESSQMRKAFIETGLMERTIQFVTGSNQGFLRLWTARGTKVGERHVGVTISCVDMTHDCVFAGDFNGTVHKYQRSNSALSCTEKTHEREVRSLVVALGFVFTASKDKTAKISDIQSLKIIWTFGPYNEVRSLNCIVVGMRFCFIGGEGGALRLSHVEKTAKETSILPKTEIRHMALNGQSLFMTSNRDSKGALYFLRDACISEDALEAKVVWEADEDLRSLAMGGLHLYVATNACIYKFAARHPSDGPVVGIDVTPMNMSLDSKVSVLKIFGEIAVVGYFPGTWELGIFNTKTGHRVALEDGAFAVTANINCIAVG